MSYINKKSANIPAFLKKTYSMLEVINILIKGFIKLKRNPMVTKWSRISHSELRTAN